MPTVFVANLAVILPSRFASGGVIGETPAQLLNEIQHKRVKVRLRYLLERGELAGHEAQAKADELMRADLAPYLMPDDGDTPDPVMEEALAIAKELIVGRMAKEGLLPPRGLDNHAKALVGAMPEIQERARLRIEERYRAATQVIAGAI